VAVFGGHPDSIDTIAAAPSASSMCATAGWDGIIRLWSWRCATNRKAGTENIPCLRPIGRQALRIYLMWALCHPKRGAQIIPQTPLGVLGSVSTPPRAPILVSLPPSCPPPRPPFLPMVCISFVSISLCCAVLTCLPLLHDVWCRDTAGGEETMKAASKKLKTGTGGMRALHPSNRQRFVLHSAQTVSLHKRLHCSGGGAVFGNLDL
jgi:hypothetical protein